jgi:hypothetical protein
LVVSLAGHSDGFNRLDLSADGRQLLTSSLDGTVRQWQVFPWVESDYPPAGRVDLLSRIRAYADEYWRERLAAEAADPAPMRVHEIAFDRSLIPPRDPQAPARLLDLTAHYTSPLNRPFQPSFGEGEDNDLRNLVPGVADYGGVMFDVRGVVQLRRLYIDAALFELGWAEQPVRVDGVPVRQTVRRLQLLLGTTGREAEGKVIAKLVWHYADGGQRESDVVYGRHVRDWWRVHDPSPTMTQARVGWEGTSPGATDGSIGYHAANSGTKPGFSFDSNQLTTALPPGVIEPGKEVRLYVASWDNPRPESEVASLDLVSAMTQSGPFVLAITVE